MSSKELTVVGAPFSTFTRTIRMALRNAKIDFDFFEALPHSKDAYKYNPFGRIPSLLCKDQVIFETLAIKDYIDTKYNAKLTPEDLNERMHMEQIVSALSDYVFHHVIFGVAKPRGELEKQKRPEEEIKKILAKKLKTAGQIIKAFDGIISHEGPFLCGERLTWADYFVYPPMADLYSLPEADFFKEQAPALYKWFVEFKKREEVEYTYPDTIAAMRANL